MCVPAESGGTACALSGSGSGCWTMFAYHAWDFEESVLKATLVRLILRPPTFNTFDLGKAYCCNTVAAFHSFDPGSGFTLT